MRIASLTTKDGQVIPVDQFTVLVGPNNAGKSQTLRDVQSRVVGGLHQPTTLIESVELERPSSFDDLISSPYIEVRPSPHNINHEIIKGISWNMRQADEMQLQLNLLRGHFDQGEPMSFFLGGLARLHISYLDAASRLVVADESASYDPTGGTPSTALQALFNQTGVDKELSDAFASAFHMDIRLDYSGMTRLRLRIAKAFDAIPQDPRAAAPVMSKYTRLDDQGDGFRSFVGVVLSVLLSKGRVVLLDEPEAFLHPAQARQLGAWLAAHARRSGSQIIVATHNPSFLAGIVETGAEVALYRVNRIDDQTSYTRIAPVAIRNLARSPLLSSQRVLEALFHRGVAVCEADADRAFYQNASNAAFGNRDVFFLHAHNKQVIKGVVELLREAAIPVCAITDFDILHSRDELESLLLALDPEHRPEPICGARDLVAVAISGTPDSDIFEQTVDSVRELVAQIEKGEHSLSGLRSALRRIEKEATPWRLAKAKGLAGVPENVRDTAAEIVAQAKAHHLFIVPVGELEGWIDLGTRKKKQWIVKALDAIAEGNIPNELRAFLASILQSLGVDAWIGSGSRFDTGR